MKRTFVYTAAIVLLALCFGALGLADQGDLPKVSATPNRPVINMDQAVSPEPADPAAVSVLAAAPSGLKSTYRLKVYIVEPEGRWLDNSGGYYFDFGFLDFLHDTTLSLDYLETFQQTKTWHPSNHGYVDTTVHQDNIMAIAVVFDTASSGTGYSNPSGQPLLPFRIRHVEAAAAATPGQPGYDTAKAGSTHTVFIEEGSTTSCPNCPYTRQALHNIYASGNYNFFYTAMVVDKCAVGDDWMYRNYNLGWVPICYFDGGDNLYLGGDISQTPYTSRIVASGQRAVPPMDLDISMDWLADDTAISVTVTLKNKLYINLVPAVPATPTGPTAGLVEDEHTFSATGTDLDGDDVYLLWDYGIAQSEWMGPYVSGSSVDAGYTWGTAGAYSVKVKVKDTVGAESGWSSSLTFTAYPRGDANGDFQANVGDAVYLINYVFKGGPAPLLLLAGDANCDGMPNVGDAVYMINYVFKGGPPPQCP